MEINSAHRRTKMLQLFFTLLLVFILVVMVAAYIYYGMYLAKKAAVTEVPQETTEAESGNDAERRAEIIKALSQEPPMMDSGQRQEIINSLSNSAPVSSADSDERRAEIIKALEQN